jgi:hypothetical protein
MTKNSSTVFLVREGGERKKLKAGEPTPKTKHRRCKDQRMKDLADRARSSSQTHVAICKRLVVVVVIVVVGPFLGLSTVHGHAFQSRLELFVGGEYSDTRARVWSVLRHSLVWVCSKSFPVPLIGNYYFLVLTVGIRDLTVESDNNSSSYPTATAIGNFLLTKTGGVWPLPLVASGWWRRN